jgi:hypothetical protein
VSRYIVAYDAQANVAYIRTSGSRVEDSSITLTKRDNWWGKEVLHFFSSKVNINELLTRQFENLVSVVK